MSELEFLIGKETAFNAKREKGYATFVDEAKNGKPVKTIRMPKSLSVLRDYQRTGVNWLHFLRKYGFGGILADDMGLGKTLQTLAYIRTVKTKKPFLIVCPKTLLFNWEAEIEKFTPELSFEIVSGTKKEREKIIEKIKKMGTPENSGKSEKPGKFPDIIITSYSLVQQDADEWMDSKITFDTIFLDEAQHIKNHKAKRTKAIKVIDADYRIAITGTPLENGVSEIWSIFDFLMPNFLDTYEHFRKDFELPISNKGDGNVLSLLSHKTKPFLLRRTKKETLTELPDKIEQNSYAELSQDQLTLYTKVLAEIKENVFKEVEVKGFKKYRIIILAALMKLRQICNHPVHVNAMLGHAKSGKIELFLDLLSDLRESGKKILVFSSFVKTLHLLRDILEKKGIEFAYLDGQTRDRKSEILKFKENKSCELFLISLKAGGTGLNLTEADTVIMFDPWWNPMVEMQAMDRAHRMGQKNTVNVYSLITKGTLEEKMLKIKARKKALFEGLVGKNDEYIKKLSWDDLQELFELG